MANDHLTLPERVAVLETKLEDLAVIKGQLNELLELKDKGIGAFWLVSLLVGSGLLGVVALVMNWLKQPHL